MKKLISIVTALLLSLCLAVVLVACGGDDTASANSADSADNTSAPDTASVTGDTNAPGTTGDAGNTDTPGTTDDENNTDTTADTDDTQGESHPGMPPMKARANIIPTATMRGSRAAPKRRAPTSCTGRKPSGANASCSPPA